MDNKMITPFERGRRRGQRRLCNTGLRNTVKAKRQVDAEGGGWGGLAGCGRHQHWAAATFPF